MSSQDHDPCQRCLRYHPPGAPCGRIEYLAPDSHEACRAEAVAIRAENARLRTVVETIASGRHASKLHDAPSMVRFCREAMAHTETR